MAGRQAKTLTELTLRRMLRQTGQSTTPLRDTVIVLLSVKAGLRACEIAGLEWSMVLDERGRVDRSIEVRDGISKYGGGRVVPMHADLRRALQALLRTSNGVGPVIQSARGGPMRSNSIVNWFVALFHSIGAHGCSSHSGRRTFITLAARSAHHFGASVRDVQMLAGHRSIETTQRYIDGDGDAQRRLVGAL